MRIVADSNDYSADRRALSFALLLCFALPLIVIPLYLFVSPEEIIARPAAAALMGGAVLFIVFFGLFLKGRGILFKVPLKVFEEGILIQPKMRLGPKMVSFEHISSIELWHGRRNDSPSGCSVLSSVDGRVSSTESFRDAEALRQFAERISPALFALGFRKSELSDPGAATIVFRKQQLHI